jgi:O-antigen ligase
MELLFVKLIALMRPLASTEYAEAIAGVSAIGMFGLGLATLLIVSAVRKSIRISAIDTMIFFFSVWCVAIYLIYFESSLISYLLKLLIPLIGYIVVKNVVLTWVEYRRLLLWMLIGSFIPTIISATLILAGNTSAVDMVNYWSGVTRWRGAFDNSHNFGLSMTLILITIVLYISLRRSGNEYGRGAFRKFENVFLVFLGVTALYCLAMSQVRTAILGLLVFGGLCLFYYNRKVLVFAAIAFGVVSVSTFPFWYPALAPELSAMEKGVDVDITDLASGRPSFWIHDIKLFVGLPIDRQLAGVGHGAGTSPADTPREHYVSREYNVLGHNDWLEMLMTTGLVGFLLFAALQILILRAILRMPGKERYLFLSLAVAVDVMMLASNSFVWRIQVSQLYYMMLGIIETRSSNAQTEDTGIRATVKAV